MSRDEFSVHRLNEEGLKQAGRLADAFSTLLDQVEAGLPPHERALVITRLQEACFFAKRGVALNPAYQDKPNG